MNTPTTMLQQVQPLLDALVHQLDGLPAAHREEMIADIARWQAMLQNVPASKSTPNAETKPYSSSELFSAVLEADPDGLAVVTVPDLVFRMVNSAYRSITPDPTVDPVGRRMDEVWPEAEVNWAAETFPRLGHAAQETAPGFQHIYRGANNHHFTMHLAPLSWENHQAVLIVAWDTTHLEQTHELLVESKEALRLSESRLRALAQSSFEGITIGRNGILIEANEQFAQMHGYALHEVIGRPVTDFLVSEDQARVMEAIESGEERVGEYQGLRKDGSTFIIEARGRSMLWNDCPVRVTVLRDITEHKHAEGAIRQSRQAMHEILESINDGFFALDRAWCYTYINRRAAEPLGYQPEALIGKNLWELFPRMRGTIAEAHYRRAMEAGEPSHYRIQGVYSKRWYDVNVYPSPEGISVFSVDRTAQVETEVALRESEQRFRVALASVPLLIYTINRDLRYTWIYNELYGIPAQEAIGKRDDELLPAEEAAELLAVKRAVLQSGQRIQHEVELSVGGKKAYFIHTLDPIKDAAGEISGITGASFDITQLRHLEAQRIEHITHLEVQQRLLEYREKERQDIARDLHDGPVQDLSGLIFNIQFAKEALQDASMKLELDQIGSTLRETVRDLRGMINELRPPSLIRFGLAKAIQFHAEDFAEKRAGLKIELDLTEAELALPEQARLGLFRIYQESLNNVGRHAHAKTIWIRLGLEEGAAVLEIRDDGQGFLVNSDLTEQTQSGHFGLAGMKERAEAIGGAFSCTSQPGLGTTIRVRCPLAG